MSERSQRERIETALPLILLIGLIVLTVEILAPFAPAIIWGIILSVSFSPFHRRLSTSLGGRRGAAATLISLLLIVALLLPMVFLSRALIAFIPDAIQWFTEVGGQVSPDGMALALPEVGSDGDPQSIWAALLADLRYIISNFGEELKPAAFWLFDEGRLVGIFVIEFALGIFLAVILLQSSDRFGEKIIQGVERVGGSFARELVENSQVTIRSTVFGVLGSAFAQTLVASLAYIIVGAPHWQILALVTFLLGLIQIGPVLVWLPLCTWLWSNDSVGLAIFMGLWGTIVIGLTDNLVRALVVARGAGLPAILAFLGALGGLLTWGIVGLFVGPVVVAVSYRVLQQWISGPHAD